MSRRGWSTPAACAAAGAEEWRAAVVAQRAATPDHGEFYALAAEMAATLQALDDLCAVLHGQVERYGKGRALYDDTRGTEEGARWTPERRLRWAGIYLGYARGYLRDAERAVQAFWAGIGHIGIEPDSGEPFVTPKIGRDDISTARFGR